MCRERSLNTVGSGKQCGRGCSQQYWLICMKRKDKGCVLSLVQCTQTHSEKFYDLGLGMRLGMYCDVDKLSTGIWVYLMDIKCLLLQLPCWYSVGGSGCMNFSTNVVSGWPTSLCSC